MSKHKLSPAPCPAAKRQHVNATQIVLSTPMLNFDALLYDEIILAIFSHLPWVDLCMLQPTNKNWARLTTDNQLWKRLFMQEFGRLRLRGSRGFIARQDGREVIPLPHRSREDDHIDWKWMFRISSNWRRGRCVVERFAEPLLYQEVSGSPISRCIALAGSITVTSSSVRSPSPPIYLHRGGATPYVLEGKHRTTSPTYVTTLSLDQSPPSVGSHELRLAVFYETGEFTVFNIDYASPQKSRRIRSYLPTHRTQRTSPIRQAAYHHPLLVTLSQSFHLSIYNLSDSSVIHTQTLSSFTSFPPTSLVLTPVSQGYRLILAYSAPVYPNHWSAAVTILNISPSQPSASRTGRLLSTEDEDVEMEPCTVTLSRTVRSWDIPPGWIDEKALRVMREQWGRKVARVADTQTDGKWVVLAPSDRLPLMDALSSHAHTKYGSTACALQLYRLSTSSSSSSPPRMTFIRMLYGHTGPVVALSLADGRCVSLGADGSIWVWDLEKGWGAEVQASTREVGTSSHHALEEYFDQDITMGTPQGSVAFDERKIVIADAFGLEARRFDT